MCSAIKANVLEPLYIDFLNSEEYEKIQAMYYRDQGEGVRGGGEVKVYVDEFDDEIRFNVKVFKIFGFVFSCD